MERGAGPASPSDSESALAALLRTTRLLGSEHDVQALVQLLTEEAALLCGARVAAFFLASDSLHPYALYGPADASLEPGMLRALWARRAISRVADLTAGFAGLPAIPTPAGRDAPPLRACLATPVVSTDGEMLGGLVLAHPEPAVFAEDHEAYVTAIATQIAVGLERSHLRTQLARERETSARALDVTERGGWPLTRPYPLAQRVELCVEALVDALGLDLCEVWQIEPVSRKPVPCARAGALREKPLPGGRPLLEPGSVLRAAACASIACDELGADPSDEVGAWLAAHGVTSRALVPLRMQDRPLGALVAYSRAPLDPALLVAMGGLAHALSLVLDVERVERERAQFRTVFTQRLGHDLRNSLNGISLPAQLLELSRDLTDAQSHALRKLRRNVHRMERTISQLVDLTELRVAGHRPLELRPTRFDLAELCARLVLEVLERGPARDVEEHYAGDTVGEWDRERLSSAYATLLEWAVESSKGPVSLSLRSEGAHVVTEIGIHTASPAWLAPLQDPFLPSGSAVRHRMTCWLYLAHEVVLAHAGTLRFESDPHTGGRALVSLPRSPNG